MSKLIIKNKYATVPNSILNNKNISLKAKGLFAFIQGKPDGWEFSTQRIANQIKESEKVVRSTLQELEKFGLLIRKQRPKDNKGKWTGYDYILQDEILNELPNPSLPKAVVRKIGSTENGKDISKQEDSNKEYSNKELILQSNDCGIITEVFDKFRKINPTLNFGNKTQRGAVSELNKILKEKLMIVVDYAISIQGQKYAPTITTPYQLKNKLSELMIFKKKEQSDEIIDVTEYL